MLTTGAVLLAAGLAGWLAGRSMRGRGPARAARWPQPGEIWWAGVPFRETAGEKIRPCLVLRGNGQTFDVLKITSKDKSDRRDHLRIPTRGWDRRATADSFLDLSAAFGIGAGDFRNYAGPIDPATWHHVQQLHPVGTVPIGAAAPGAVPRAAGRVLTVLGPIAAVVGLLMVCAGATVVPWLDRVRGEGEAAAGADRPLHRLPIAASAVGSSGQQLDSTLNGRHFADSTGFWVGCEGQPATATYQLDGAWHRLTATAGLDVTAPADVTAKLVVELDGKAALTDTVSRTRTVAVDLDLTGVRMLTVSAVKNKGSCGNATRPYGALGDAVVHH